MNMFRVRDKKENKWDDDPGDFALLSTGALLIRSAFGCNYRWKEATAEEKERFALYRSTGKQLPDADGNKVDLLEGHVLEWYHAGSKDRGIVKWNDRGSYWLVSKRDDNNGAMFYAVRSCRAIVACHSAENPNWRDEK